MSEPCNYDPRTIPASAPIGMFHCPKCGDMVVAGLPHPSPLDDLDARFLLEEPEDNSATAATGD